MNSNSKISKVAELLPTNYLEEYIASLQKALNRLEQLSLGDLDEDEIIDFFYSVFSAYDSQEPKVREYVHNYFTALLIASDLKATRVYNTLAHLFATIRISKTHGNIIDVEIGKREIMSSLREIKQRMENGLAINGHNEIISLLGEDEKFLFIERILEILVIYFEKGTLEALQVQSTLEA